MAQVSPARSTFRASLRVSADKVSRQHLPTAQAACLAAQQSVAADNYLL
jgi:hypothetical protein